MDPKLKLIVNGQPNEVLHLLMRLKDAGKIPEKVTPITKFGDVISCRILRKDLREVYNNSLTKSLKAPHVIPVSWTEREEEDGRHPKPKTISKETEHESPVVFGIVDYGFDFTHADLQTSGGKTRFDKIWIQNQTYDKKNKYGYGRVVDKKDINKALQTDQPFYELNYHPGKYDLGDRGMHGTHVLAIAAGSGRVGRKGFACNSPFIAVDLGSDIVNGSNMSLGDSVKLIEAIDFILQNAGNRNVVINMSLGGHCGEHTGHTLVEIALNNAIKNRPGLAIVQSTGNYLQAGCHSQFTLTPHKAVTLEWIFKPDDKTPNEMEIWYEKGDRVTIEVLGDDGRILGSSKSFQDIAFDFDKGLTGVILHRANEPNTSKSNANIILPTAPLSGRLFIRIVPKSITNGKFNAYIERDDAGQSRFAPENESMLGTLGSICNAPLSITVGACLQSSKNKLPLSFSSSGPTVDGRIKPEILGPGYKIVAAKSAKRSEQKSANELVEKSGSSMAAPYIASLVVKLFETKPNLNIYTLRKLLFACCDRQSFPNSIVQNQHGYGVINMDKFKELLQNLRKNKTKNERNIYNRRQLAR